MILFILIETLFVLCLLKRMVWKRLWASVRIDEPKGLTLHGQALISGHKRP
jgi:hypothetical protein